MGFTHFPNGVTSFGLPMIYAGPSIPVNPWGNYFFVNSTGGDDGKAGTSPGKCFATIDAAVNEATAGDVIIVAPGHTETIAAATTLVLDEDEISVIGLGHGSLRPTLSFSTTASRIPISGDGIRFENFLCVGAVADIVSGITVTGDDCILRGIEVRSGGAVLEFLQFIDIDAATRPVLEFCKVVASSTAGSNTGLRVDACVDPTIRFNEFLGDFTTAAVSGNAGTGAASTGVQCYGNFVQNLDATAGLCIDMHDDSTGIIMDNRMFTLFTTAPETVFDPGDCLCCENYVVNDEDESGTIVPVTLST